MNKPSLALALHHIFNNLTQAMEPPQPPRNLQPAYVKQRADAIPKKQERPIIQR